MTYRLAARSLALVSLLVGCGSDDAPTPADTDPTSTGSSGDGPTSGPTTTPTASTSSAETGPDDSTGPGDTSGGSTTGEPPSASCDGHPAATDALGVTAGELRTYATFEHISATWAVTGDTNGNATVNVRLRPEGGSWRTGTPLRRVRAGSNPSGPTWPETVGGSQFALEPETVYELELQLIDDDGGCVVETVEVQTRGPLRASETPNVVEVTPDSLAAALSGAQPGDTLALQPGNYSGFEVGVDGTAEAPIVIQGREGVVVDGQITVRDRAYLILEDLRVLDRIRFDDSHDLTIRRCRIESAGDGIVMLGRGENNYVHDNDVQGSTVWSEAALGVNGDNLGEGIMVSGPGHVIEHNRVVGFRDCISFLEDTEAEDQHDIDVLRNDLETCADDGVEADFCEHDCRILENRLTNTFIALSSQPSLGGPTYFVRNSIYNVLYMPFKLLRNSEGDVLWHNTVVKSGDAFAIYTDDAYAHLHTRNNLFLGGPGGAWGGWDNGSGRVIRLAAVDVASLDFDFDAFGSTTGTFEARVGEDSYATLAELRAGTTAANAIEIDANALGGASVPSAPFPALAPADLSLSEDSPAVDAAEPIPGLNDDFMGSGPDMGAHERGAPLPAYGPRE